MNEAEAPSIRRGPIAVAMIAISAAAVLVIGLATARSAAAGQDARPSPQATGYVPSISDLMIATIQPRHERLWQSVQDGNLHGAFNRLGQAHPVEHDISFPEMIVSATEQPFKELSSAIQAKDHTAFAKAYADLTDACNSCHQALNHGVVKIRVPNRTSASDLSAISTPRN